MHLFSGSALSGSALSGSALSGSALSGSARRSPMTPAVCRLRGWRGLRGWHGLRGLIKRRIEGNAKRVAKRHSKHFGAIQIHLLELVGPASFFGATCHRNTLRWFLAASACLCLC